MTTDSEKIVNLETCSCWEITSNQTEGTVLTLIEATEKNPIRKVPYLLAPHKKHPIHGGAAILLAGPFTSLYNHLLLTINLEHKFGIYTSAMQAFCIKRSETGHLAILKDLDSAKVDATKTRELIQNNSLQLSEERKIILFVKTRKNEKSISAKLQKDLYHLIKTNLYTNASSLIDMLLQTIKIFIQKNNIEEIFFILHDGADHFHTLFLKSDNLHEKISLMKALDAHPTKTPLFPQTTYNWLLDDKKKTKRLMIIRLCKIITFASTVLAAVIGVIAGLTGSSLVTSSLLFYGLSTSTIGLILGGAIIGVVAGLTIGAFFSALTMLYTRWHNTASRSARVINNEKISIDIEAEPIEKPNNHVSASSQEKIINTAVNDTPQTATIEKIPVTKDNQPVNALNLPAVTKASLNSDDSMPSEKRQTRTNIKNQYPMWPTSGDSQAVDQRGVQLTAYTPTTAAL